MLSPAGTLPRLRTPTCQPVPYLLDINNDLNVLADEELDQLTTQLITVC